MDRLEAGSVDQLQLDSQKPLGKKELIHHSLKIAKTSAGICEIGRKFIRFRHAMQTINYVQLFSPLSWNSLYLGGIYVLVQLFFFLSFCLIYSFEGVSLGLLTSTKSLPVFEPLYRSTRPCSATLRPPVRMCSVFLILPSETHWESCLRATPYSLA